MALGGTAAPSADVAPNPTASVGLGSCDDAASPSAGAATTWNSEVLVAEFSLAASDSAANRSTGQETLAEIRVGSACGPPLAVAASWAASASSGAAEVAGPPGSGAMSRSRPGASQQCRLTVG